MSAFEDEVENDTCCFCIPIVCGMKSLGLGMVASNALFLIVTIYMMAQGAMPGLAVFLGVVNIVLQLLIIFGVGSWVLDKEKRQWLIRGLLANIGQALLQTIIMGMNAGAINEIGVNEAQAALTRLEENPPKDLDEERVAQAIEGAERALELAKANGETGIIVFMSFTVLLAAYFHYEARQYDAKADGSFNKQ